MYRQYENPILIEVYLKEAQDRLARALEEGVCEERLVDLHDDVEWLKERLNIAWADDEAAEFGYDY